MKRIAVSLLLCLTLVLIASAQDKAKRPSPPDTATFSFSDGKKITINYSRPSVKGRKIYAPDGLVPFGKVWRTGANEATTFVTDTPLMIGNTNVPAGSYTLYTIPDKSGWKLIINKQTGQWGTQYDESKDLARVDMAVAQTPSPVEQFTIHFEPKGGKTVTLMMDWETTRASVDMTEAK